MKMLLRMLHKIYAFADDGIEMLDLLRSVLAEHALGRSGTTKTVDTFEADIALEIQASILGGVAIGICYCSPRS